MGKQNLRPESIGVMGPNYPKDATSPHPWNGLRMEMQSHRRIRKGTFLLCLGKHAPLWGSTLERQPQRRALLRSWQRECRTNKKKQNAHHVNLALEQRFGCGLVHETAALIAQRRSGPHSPFYTTRYTPSQTHNPNKHANQAAKKHRTQQSHSRQTCTNAL